MECNVEAPDNIAIDIAKVLLTAMEDGAKPFCTNLPLPGDLALDKDGNLPTYWIHWMKRFKTSKFIKLVIIQFQYLN